MTTYYDITEKIRTHLEADIDINTVTHDKIYDIVAGKHTMYAVCDIDIDTFSVDGATITYDISVFALDKVDVNKDEATDKFRGNDNLIDVLNTLASVLVRLNDELRRGDLHADGYHLVSELNSTRFRDRLEDKVDGWVGTFSVQCATNMTIC